MKPSNFVDPLQLHEGGMLSFRNTQCRCPGFVFISQNNSQLLGLSSFENFLAHMCSLRFETKSKILTYFNTPWLIVMNTFYRYCSEKHQHQKHSKFIDVIHSISFNFMSKHVFFLKFVKSCQLRYN